jgi:hypothetical protein
MEIPVIMTNRKMQKTAEFPDVRLGRSVDGQMVEVEALVEMTVEVPRAPRRLKTSHRRREIERARRGPRMQK